MHEHREQLLAVAAIYAAALLCTGLAGCNHVDATSEPVGFTAWSVPAGSLKARVQVRLAPKSRIADAVLEASSPGMGIRFDPPRFILKDLAPAPLPADKSHNPPALGKTTLRTFLITVSRPGNYTVRIRLLWNDHVETRSVMLRLGDARAP